MPGVGEKPHGGRTAFFARRIFVTLAADQLCAHLKLTADQQALKCLTHPAAFSVLDNGWGRQGWTVMRLEALSAEELAAQLHLAWVSAR